MTEVVDQVVSDDQPKDASGSEVIAEPKRDTVAYETHRKLLGEKKTVQKKYDDLVALNKAGQDKALAEQGEYKDLYGQTKERVEALETELADAKDRQDNFVKLRAVLSAIDGKVDQDYYGHLGIDNVLLDPDTGEVDKMSVSKVVEAFKAKHSVLIQGNRPANLPKNAPQYANGEKKLTKEEQNMRTSELMRSL